MKRAGMWVLDHAVIFLCAGVVFVFSLMAPGFASLANLENLLVQSSSTAILAAGMTFVLLVAGVDLSVGSLMFLTAAIAGKMSLAGSPPLAVLLAMVAVGVVTGLTHGVIITRTGMSAFIVTLGTLSIGRGAGIWITKTRAMNLPEEYLVLGSSRVAGVPVPLLVCGIVLSAAHLTLSHTSFGRQLYAIGHDSAKAAKAGLDTRRLLLTAYILCGVCAVVGGILSLSQIGAVSPGFGLNREFSAIAAAVLGGTSLFGGRGTVLPGSLLGAVLIQSVENGLVAINADPYLYPLVTSGVIFFAVLLDTTRQRLHERFDRRSIF